MFVELVLAEVVEVVEVDEPVWVVVGFKGTNATAAPITRIARIATPAKSGVLRSIGVTQNRWWLRLLMRTPCLDSWKFSVARICRFMT